MRRRTRVTLFLYFLFTAGLGLGSLQCVGVGPVSGTPRSYSVLEEAGVARPKPAADGHSERLPACEGDASEDCIRSALMRELFLSEPSSQRELRMCNEE